MDHNKLKEALEGIDDAELSTFKFYAPWQSGPTAEEEGDALSAQLAHIDMTNTSRYYQVIQKFLWEKFQEKSRSSQRCLTHGVKGNQHQRNGER